MDLLNLAAEERVNLADLSFALTDSITGQHAELAQGLFLPGAGATAATIVSGFVPAAAGAGGPVTVGQATTVNSAFLCRLGGDGALHPAELIYGGQSVISIDVSTFPTNTYGIYVRALRSAQTVQNRAFWSGVDASEYAQLTPTRLVASWEVRIETASPGAEWLRIGQAQVAAAGAGGQGASVVVTDQRPLLFEGAASSGYAPTWGTAADRGPRQAATITSLGQMVDALKQSIVDIKGRGLQPWYAPTIGGLNIGGAFGLSDSPANNRLALGDSSFYLQNLTATTDGTSTGPLIAFAGTADYLGFNRGAGALFRSRSGTPVMTWYSNGGALWGAGSPSGFFTVNPTAAAQYGLAVRTTDGGNPASLGLLSAGATSAFVELGTIGYQNAYGLIRATWSGTPSLSFFVNNVAFLSAANGTGASPAIVTLSGQVNLPPSPSYGGRASASGGVVWAVGYFSVAQNTVFASCGGGVTAQGSQTNKTTIITFSAAMPTANIVMVTPLISNGDDVAERSLAASYKVSGSQLVVQVRNDDAALVAVDFSFVVFYGT